MEDANKRLSRWEKKVDLMAHEIRGIQTDVQRHEENLIALSREISDLRLDWTRALNQVNQSLIETVTRLKVQTRFSLLMILTLIPTQVALLWKIFVG